MAPGDELGVRGPYGTGWPLEAATGKDLVLAAGGIGLAPLRSVGTHPLEHPDQFASVSLLYGARSPSELLYVEELRAWRGDSPVHVLVTVDRSEPGWTGDVGVVTNLMPRAQFDPANTVSFLCGPEIMMKVVGRELASVGLGPDDIFISMERNMKCGIGFCGHCQFGPDFLCRDGPVLPYGRVMERMTVEEL